MVLAVSADGPAIGVARGIVMRIEALFPAQKGVELLLLFVGRLCGLSVVFFVERFDSLVIHAIHRAPPKIL